MIVTVRRKRRGSKTPAGPCEGKAWTCQPHVQQPRHPPTHTHPERQPPTNTHPQTNPEGHPHSLRGTPPPTQTHTHTHPEGHPTPHPSLPAPSGPGPHTPSAAPLTRPHLPSASKRRQAPRKAEASRRPSAPLSMVLLLPAPDPAPALPSPSGTASAPAPPPGPAFRAAAPPRGRPHGGRRGKSPPSRGSSHRPVPILLGCDQPQVVAGRGSAVEVRWSSPSAQPERAALASEEQCAARKHLRSFKPPERREKCCREASMRLQSSGVHGEERSFLKLVTLLLGL